MPVGEIVLNGIIGHTHPLAVLVLGVAKAGLIEIHLAQIVQKSHDGGTFVAIINAVDLLDARAGKNVT